MARMITLNVTNKSRDVQNFFFFQQPAQYAGGAQVYSNSLFTAPLLPYNSSGSVLTFTMVLQNYAGVQRQTAPPTVGQPSGPPAVSQAINLTPAAGGAPTANTTRMTVSPSLGLSAPVSAAGPRPGSFRIVTPAYNPALGAYNAGSAIQSAWEGIALSSFVTAQPNSNLDCQPVMKFYVQIGAHAPGTVINFASAQSTAAECDAAPGYTAFNVSYNPDGWWTVQPLSLAQGADGPQLLAAGSDQSAAEVAAPPINAYVLNEAGTLVISTGSTADPTVLPMTIRNLSNAGAIQQLREYQVGAVNGPYQEAICTAVGGDAGTFA